MANYFALFCQEGKEYHDLLPRKYGLEEKLSQVQILFHTSPECHPDFCPLSECPAPLVHWFGVNMKKGHRKEKSVLNAGNPSALQRTLVLFSLFFFLLINSILTFSVLLLQPRQWSFFCKNNHSSDPSRHQRACDLQKSHGAPCHTFAWEHSPIGLGHWPTCPLEWAPWRLWPTKRGYEFTPGWSVIWSLFHFWW